MSQSTLVENTVAARYHERDGYYVARALLAPDEVADIRVAFMTAAQDGPVDGISDESWRGCDANDPLRRYPRMMQPHRHPASTIGRLALKYLIDARIRDILRLLLSDEPLGAQTMFYFKPPGSRGQDLHQDNFYLHARPGTCMAAWIAIDDASPENGGMFLVPGTHRMDIARPEAADPERSFTTHRVGPPDGVEAIPLNLAGGDVLFFNGSAIHGSYPNESPVQFRRALINHYVTESTAEVSGGYQPLVRFDGTETQINEPADADGL